MASLYNHFLSVEAQSVEVVLVSPRNPLNIGAVARAMANFGFEHLTVVAPFAPHWREARSAVGAPELLQNAKASATFAEAVAGCTLVIGTGTLTHRKPEQRVVPLPATQPLVLAELGRGGRVALVFGPEKHGLTRKDLSWCHLLVEIPTDARQPSMNLGQAVAVCLYELAAGVKARGNTAGLMYGLKPVPSLKPVAFLKSGPVDESSTSEISEPSAPSGRLDLLAGVIEETIAAAHYSPASMQAANRHDLRLLLRRLAPTERDTRRILGLFRRILWRLHQNGKGN
jgi:TrmH family RNA methyltransferase